jgi:hypothetical protein
VTGIGDRDQSVGVGVCGKGGDSGHSSPAVLRLTVDREGLHALSRPRDDAFFQASLHQYFILKTIIINNLYGVDIMEEATEICKLRLFLKLVSQIDPKHKDRIEPLPDIDFNIRAGKPSPLSAVHGANRPAGAPCYWSSVAPWSVSAGWRSVQPAFLEDQRLKSWSRRY